MNILWLLFTVLFSSFVQRSCAYGERGIPERALYYIAYLAEEELHKLDESTKLTIAPGCVGKSGGRCSFDEFVLHIWAPKDKGMEKPTGFKKNFQPKITTLGSLDATSAFNKMMGKIGNAQFNTGELLNGEIDVNKLMPSKSNFYDALSSMGDPIGALAAELDKRENMKAVKPDELPFQRTKEQKQVLKWGKATSFYISALRGKDQDQNRRSFFKKYFKDKLPEGDAKKITIETMEVETPMDQKKPEADKTKRKGKIPERVPLTVPMIDFTKTIEQNKNKIEGFKEKLEEANAAFMAKETTKNGKVERYNEAHRKAFLASKMAASATGCTRELPRELKKRKSLTELNLRSPKAVKSMRVKARKLGFKM